MITPALLNILRCPRTGQPLTHSGSSLAPTSSAGIAYPLIGGIPDLRHAPERLTIDVPWIEPWTDLDHLTIEYPEPIRSAKLPYHLDGYLASIAGKQGEGKRVLEIGCGERQCESWFASHGFEYIGSDVDIRGIGPHVLADAHNLPFAPASFDYYCSMAVYEHLVSPLSAYLEAYRVLRPGGIVFGSAAFVYGFHDRASFHHSSHAGILHTLRSAGFQVQQMWPDWHYTSSIPEMAFRGARGAPWRTAARIGLQFLEGSFWAVSAAARKLTGKPGMPRIQRNIEFAGSVSFCARKPAS